MPELTKERLAEIEARAAKATIATGLYISASDQGDAVIAATDGADQMALMHFGRLDDAEFWLHARTDIPDLIAAVRELQAENERLRDAGTGQAAGV